MRTAISLLFLAFAAFGQNGNQPKPPACSGNPETKSQQDTTSFVRDLRGERGQLPSGRSYGILSGSLPARDAAGKSVRFSAWIKTENVRDGYAGLWWSVQGPGETNNRPILAFDNSEVRSIGGKPDARNGNIRGATGTTSWTLYALELPIDKAASYIYFGALLTGTGTAWVDAMKIELDGVQYTPPEVDLGFESPTVRGFIVGCGGSAICTGYKYKTGIDNTVSYSGRQSLKMQYLETKK
jgi:hypothetical protein